MVEKLPELKEAFYFGPCRDKTQFQYENSVVGLIAGLERKTAHSLRVTCATRQRYKR